MDVQQIVDVISNVGFPIVCVGMMGFYIEVTMKDFSKQIEALEDTINANSNVIAELGAYIKAIHSLNDSDATGVING